MVSKTLTLEYPYRVSLGVGAWGVGGKKPDPAAEILPGVGAGEGPDPADIGAAHAPTLVGADEAIGQGVQVAGADDVGDIGRRGEVGKAGIAGADLNRPADIASR
jgi:hypothetical protein